MESIFIAFSWQSKDPGGGYLELICFQRAWLEKDFSVNALRGQQPAASEQPP